ERRRPVVETGTAVREPLVCRSLISSVQLVAERMRPDVVGVEQQAMAELLLEINLEPAVVVVAVRILVVHGVQERVGAEEVEGKSAGCCETDAGARSEVASDQAAKVGGRGGQRIG